MRTFLAIKPPPKVLSRISKDMQILRTALPSGIKWVPISQIHLTLKFLGDFEPRHIERLKNILLSDLGDHGPVSFGTLTINMLPARGKPRVICYRGQANNTLLSISRIIEEAAAALGYPSQKRAFLPHLTIGRFKRRANNHHLKTARKILGTYQHLNLPPFVTDSVLFIKSTLTPLGPEYERIFSIHL